MLRTRLDDSVILNVDEVVCLKPVIFTRRIKRARHQAILMIDPNTTLVVGANCCNKTYYVADLPITAKKKQDVNGWDFRDFHSS